MGRRSRKRSGTGPPPAPVTAPAVPRRATRLDSTRMGTRAAGRPKSRFDPVPVSEILIGCGLLAFIIGFVRGPDAGGVLIAVGVLLATGGVVELCGREHFSGYRSHVLLLAFLPVVALHTFVRLVVTDSWEGPKSLITDLLVFGLLCLWLLDRYRAARGRTGS